MKSNPVSAALITLVLGSGFMSPAASADHHGMHDGPDPKAIKGEMRREHKGLQRILENLELTSEQEAAVKKLMDANRDDVNRQRAMMHEARSALKDIAYKDNYNQAKVDALTRDIGKAMSKLVSMKISTKRNIYLLLTPEQQRKMRRMDQEQRQRHGKKGGKYHR